MRKQHTTNPLLPPILASFQVKRKKRTGLVPANWLITILRILDAIRVSDRPLEEDDIYTYDFTLKGSRAAAIPKLLEKYQLPPYIGIGKEGVTVRGAPGYRVFRAIGGGKVVFDRPKKERDEAILEAVELVRQEIAKVVSQKPITLLSHEFDQTGLFLAALMKNVQNRSDGRVEQVLVGAKLHLRFPTRQISTHRVFAGDRQTARKSDFEVGNLCVIVSASPKPDHFDSAVALADQNRQVYLVVSLKAVASARKHIESIGYSAKIHIDSVEEYVAKNMAEVSNDIGITPREMCLKLAAEYNRRMDLENAPSLKVVIPEE